ncbi:hypothetical protein ZWY2020_055083 [Hordeum vulgare]|nr:hypothetical protein ZWY2020_055083 [Hordeum vulgare]
MAKPWGILLLVSMAFALGITSNFLLRFLPATATMIQLIAADLSVPALVLRPPSLRLLGDDNAKESGSNGGNESWRMVMLHNMTDDELVLAASMAPRISSLVQGAPKVAFMFLEARWGQSSIVEAERRLLANALLDTTNEHFVLLSETCIPLYNFTTVYSYLTHSTGATSFIDLFDNASSRGRYKRAMAPAITPAQWRKGSQWFAVDQSLALGVIDDVT